MEASAGAVQPRNTHCAGRYVPAVLMIIIIVTIVIVFIIVFFCDFCDYYDYHDTIMGGTQNVLGNMYPKIIRS